MPLDSGKNIEHQIDPLDIAAWYPVGACSDVEPDVMFPTDVRGNEIAKNICAGCAVTSLCLEYALETRQKHGVWGGTSERDRRRILRQRRRAL